MAQENIVANLISVSYEAHKPKPDIDSEFIDYMNQCLAEADITKENSHTIGWTFIFDCVEDWILEGSK